MSKHTPGPWVWGEDYRGLFGSGPNNEVLSWYAYEGMHLIQGNTEANARLIAAAPRMYAVIEAGARAGDAECLAIMDQVEGKQ